MQQDKDQLEQAFKDKVSSYEAEPPIDGWEDIAFAMDQGSGRNRLVYILIAASLLLFLGTAGVLFHQSNQTNTITDNSIQNGEEIETINQSVLCIAENMNTEGIVHETDDCSLFEDAPNNCEPNKNTRRERFNTSVSTSASVANRSRRDLKHSKQQASNNITSIDASTTNSSSDDSSNSSSNSSSNNSDEIDQALPDQQESNSDVTYAVLDESSKEAVPITDSITIVALTDENIVVTPDEKVKKEKPHLWALKVSAEVNYSFKKITPAVDGYFIDGLTNKNQPSIDNGGYQFDVQLRRKLTKRWAAYGSIGFSHTRENIEYTFYKIVPESYEIRFINSSSYEIEPLLDVEENSFKNKSNQVHSSLGLCYSLKKGKRPQSIHIGFSLSNLINGEISSSDTGQNLFYNKNFTAIDLAWENTFPLKSNLSLLVSTNLSYSLASIYSANSVYSSQPIIFSLNFGFLKQL